MARKIEPVYLFTTRELVLNVPIDVAWRHVLAYEKWQQYSKLETLSGTPGQVGHMTRLIKEEKGFTFPTYRARLLLLEPPHRVVWKTWPEEPSEGNDFFGIVDFRLRSEGKATRFISEIMYEFNVPHEHESELLAFREQQAENFRVLQDSIMPKLKLLAEAKT